MIKRLIFVLTMLLLCSNPCFSYVRDYSELSNTWEGDSNKAYISGKTTFEDGKTILNLFQISFEKQYECKPLFKISFLEGNEYGDLQQTIPVEEGVVKLYVDDNLIYDGPTVKLIYTNVTEFGASVTEDILNKITSGKIIKIELVDLMDIKFNLNKSKVMIDKAHENCMQK